MMISNYKIIFMCNHINIFYDNEYIMTFYYSSMISCICMRPWKKCVNRRTCKKLNDYVSYNMPYSIGMAELGYEYDFLNNKKIKNCSYWRWSKKQ